MFLNEEENSLTQTTENPRGIQPGQIQARGSLCVRVRPLSMLQQPLPHVAPGDGKMLFTALNLYFLRFNFNSKKMCLSAKSECHYS